MMTKNQNHNTMATLCSLNNRNIYLLNANRKKKITTKYISRDNQHKYKVIIFSFLIYNRTLSK